MSSAFHAKAGNQPDWQQRWALLSDAEQANVDGWKLPTDVERPAGRPLKYAEADKEVVLGLDVDGWYVDPATGEECLTIGHMDFGWVVTDIANNRLAYVCDIKKSEWTSTDGPESLQLHAYARAYALKHDCAGYVVGLWIAEDGEWMWSQRVVWLASDEAEKLWQRIYYAAKNISGEANTGAHCRSCYGRLYCVDHVLPAAAAQTWLAPVAAGQRPTNESAARFMFAIQAAEEVLKKAKENMQMWIERGEVEVRDAEGGKVYRGVKVKGREALDKEALQRVLGEEYQGYIKRGSPYFQYRWVKG